MKKQLFLIFTLLFCVLSCVDDRDISAEHELNNKEMSNTQKQSLCSPGFVAPVLYGNPNNYPKINISTYYSMNKPNNQQWLFDEMDSSIIDYFRTNYTPNAENVVPWSTTNFFPTGWDTFQYDYEYSTETIYRTDPEVDGNLTPDTIISPKVGSYILYRILSNIDSEVKYRMDYFSLRIRPVAIKYSYSYTMCGDYIGMYAKVYYKEY